jgi:hypothetical protein
VPHTILMTNFLGAQGYKSNCCQYRVVDHDGSNRHSRKVEFWTWSRACRESNIDEARPEEVIDDGRSHWTE